MKYINYFNNSITLISLFLNIIIIIKFIKNIFDFLFKKYFIKKVLGYSNEAVNICCYDESYASLSHHDIEATNNIIKLFFNINQKFVLTGVESDGNNEMCVGGFLVNRKINKYMVNYFEDFRYITSPDLKEKYGENPFIEYIPNKNGYKIKDKELLFESGVDYVFLIKLTKSDFYGANKTVHIIHGTNEVGLIRGSEFLMTKYKKIYEKFKNNHYFFALEIICRDKSINYSKDIIDLTDKMFT